MFELPKKGENNIALDYQPTAAFLFANSPVTLFGRLLC